IFFHTLVNAGMAMGIMPITGIPLMLVSYGGSSLWTALIGVGILMNISRRRLRY
ncbi:MAG TPA: FtsW/RodA/SpoVE family cell cycle protein, partial [Spirochaetia bacterium]